MSLPTMWEETHKSLEDFMSCLKCLNCKKTLVNPHRFGTCGCVVCQDCVRNDSNCVICNVPTTPCEIQPDLVLNSILIQLNIIAAETDFNLENINAANQQESVSEVLPVVPSEKRKRNKSQKKKINEESTTVDETLDTQSVSVFSTATTFSKPGSKKSVGKSIPKNINKKNQVGETKLHTACKKGQFEKVKDLLESGANPNTKDHAGWTPLQEASSFGYYNICQILLTAETNPNTPGVDNSTALHEAVKNNHKDIILLLLENNANTNVFDRTGKKPEDYANSKEIADLFKNADKRSEISVSSTDRHKSVNLNQTTLNQSICETSFLLYGSGLSDDKNKELNKLAKKMKVKCTNKFSQSVSHVIVETDNGKIIEITLDILFTILYGKWLLSSDCIAIWQGVTDFSEADVDFLEVQSNDISNNVYTIARENAEKMNPGLFNNCNFYFSLNPKDVIVYNGIQLTREDLVNLVKAGDGNALTREPKTDVESTNIPFHLAHDEDHPLYKCTNYIIYIPGKAQPKVIYNMPHLKSLPLKWFIESICKFQLLRPIEIGLVN